MVHNGPRHALVVGDGVVDGVVVEAVVKGARGELVVHQAVPVTGVGVHPHIGQVAVVGLGVGGGARGPGGLTPGGALVAPGGGVPVVVGRGGLLVPGDVVDRGALPERPATLVVLAVEGVGPLEVEVALLVDDHAGGGVVRVGPLAHGAHGHRVGRGVRGVGLGGQGGAQ